MAAQPDKKSGGLLFNTMPRFFSAVAPVAPGITAGWEKIAEVTLTAAATSIDFTGLDLDAAKAYKILLIAYNPTVTNTSLGIYFSGDYVDANYYSQRTRATGTTVITANSNFPLIATYNTLRSVLVEILIMRVSGKKPLYWASCHDEEGTAIMSEYYSGHWVSALNVTSIRLHCYVALGLDVGTKAILFKITG